MSQPSRPREPLAIVGIGCRLPGAYGPDAFWSLLVNETDAVGEMPADRFGAEVMRDAATGRSGRISTVRGGFLENLERFDAQFFGIAPREACCLDPQQRLLLEVAWEALEDAGLIVGELAGSRTGVFVGSWLSDFEMRLSRTTRPPDIYTATGSGRYSTSGRVSFAFGFEGPSLTVDTACSSGLAAVHLACQSLWTEESTLALAGASNVILEPHISLAYSRAGMLAPDGRCKFGDARADGYVRSEGAAMIVLKPLARAMADGDPIYAAILGSAVNNNGHSSGYLLRPARSGHEKMLREAYRSAGVQPADVQYVEAHGTGTIAGDPVELEALGAVLGEGRRADGPCLVGSVKTNIGHTEAVAGIAGLIKVALSLKHGQIPASLNFEQPNPRVPWDTLPVAIVRKRQPWKSEKPIAGVSAFGITGTNAHVVLQGVSGPATGGSAESTAGRPQLLVVSARSEESLRALGSSYRDRLTTESMSPDSLEAFCGWAAGRRDHHPYRIAVVGRDAADLAARLDNATLSPAAYRTPPIAFVFPGQGGQWLGMGRQLWLEESAFREALRECDAAIAAQVGWSIVEELNAGPDTARFGHIDVVQPSIFAVQVALAALWRSWGIEPTAVVGHSMGEIAAAAVAGRLSVANAARVICVRSRLMRSLTGAGAMGVVALSREDTARALRQFGSRLSIAAINSPSSTVVSGEPAALDELFTRLQDDDVFCRRVKVDIASHSAYVDALNDELVASLAGVQPLNGPIRMYSTVDGEPVVDPDCDARYWSRNLRQPVMFLSAVRSLIEGGVRAIVEISPHPVLESALSEIARDMAAELTVVPSTRRDESERGSMLSALGTLYTSGCAPDFCRVMPPSTPVRLPSYAWQRKRFWYDETGHGGQQAGYRSSGGRLESSINPGTSLWPVEQCQLTADGRRQLLLLADTAKQLSSAAELTAVEIRSLAGDAPAEVQRVAVTSGPDCWTIHLSTRENGAWTVVARATVRASGCPVERPQTAGTCQRTFDVNVSSGGDAPTGDWLEAALTAALDDSTRCLGAPSRIARVDALTLDCPTATHVEGSLRLTREGTAVDVRSIDSDGQGRMAMSGLTLQPQSPSTVARNAVCALAWERTSIEATRREGANGAVLVVGHGDPTAREIATKLRREGCRVACFAVGHRGADVGGEYSGPFDRWDALEDMARQWKSRGEVEIDRVVYVAPAANTTDAESSALPTEVSDSTLELGRVVQWLAQTNRSTTVSLWVVTSGVWALADNGKAAGLAHAPLWGFARTVARAHPELVCSSVDLGSEPQAAEIESLIRLVGSQPSSVEMAFRADAGYAPKFRALAASLERTADPSIHPDRTYLLTGGLGGVAIEVARWLVDRGAKHLVLLSRRSPGVEDLAHITMLETGGAAVRVIQADVSQRAAVTEALRVIDHAMPPLAGIVHAAGVADDAPSVWSRSSLQAVFGGKADGAWHLHCLTRDRPLDFFVLCSSITASLAQAGEGVYAAANAFLDALAFARRAEGLTAVSIQWGIWAETGLARRSGAWKLLERWVEQGVGALTPEIALMGLGTAMAGNPACAFVAPVNWTAFAAAGRGDTRRGLFEHLASVDAGTPKLSSDIVLGAALQEASPQQRRLLVRQCLREQLAQVLRTEVSSIDPNRPLGTLGLDSLLSVEFVRRVSTALGVKLPPTIVFSYPTFAALESEVIERVQTPPKAGAGAARAQEAPVTIESAAVADMSEEEAILALMATSRGLR